MYRNRILIKRATTLLNAQRSVSYKLPTINTLETLKSTSQDFSGLFSNKTVDELWFKRGEQLVEGLNQSLEQANGASNGSQSPDTQSNNLLDLVSQTIHKPELFGIYSYASLLYNLQFFMESLKEGTKGKAEIKFGVPSDLLKTPTESYTNLPSNDELRDWIVDSFGSIEEFRTLLLNSAMGIKGDGIVWLVAESNLSQSILKNSPSITEPGATKEAIYNNLAIVNTYNTGIVDDSIRSGQINRLKLQKDAKIVSLKNKKRQRENINELDQQELDVIQQEIESLEQEIDHLTLGTTEEAEFNTLYNDKKLLPLLAIDGSMRNYLLDYGVFGKQSYLDNVWECIDWDIVGRRMPERTKQFINAY